MHMTCSSVLSLVQFCFPLFFFALIYDNEYKTKENLWKIEPKIKLNYNTYMPQHRKGNLFFYKLNFRSGSASCQYQAPILSDNSCYK